MISLVFGKINSTRRVRLPVNGMEDGTGRKASRNSAKVEMRCQSGRKSGGGTHSRCGGNSDD